MLSTVKNALRISQANTAFDEEIVDLISAAQMDLVLSGVTTAKANDVFNPLIRQAIITYCKAHFGLDNPDSEKYQRSYDLLKSHLTLAGDFSAHLVTFTVTSGGQPIDGVEITLEGVSTPLVTNLLGVALYRVIATGIDIDFTVAKTGYITQTGAVYVAGNVSVEVVLVAVE